MNEFEKRRVAILVEAFYRLKSMHHGGAVLSPGSFDYRDFEKWMATEGHPFVEVKEVMMFVFFREPSKFWAGELKDLASFARAYSKICDQSDAWFPYPRSPAVADDKALPGNHIQTPEQAEKSLRAGLEAAGLVDDERPSDDAREMYEPKEPKGGILAMRQALQDSSGEDG